MSRSSSAHNLASLLARSAHVWPRQPAIALGDKPLHDYATLAGRVSRLGGALRSQGHELGTRVLLIASNVPAYIEAMLSCWWAGCVAVPVNAKLHPREALYVLDNSGASVVFADAGWEDAVRVEGSAHRARIVRFDGAEYTRMLAAEPITAPVEVRSDDAAWLFYTSGTTGRPKGVVLTHANLFAMTLAFLADVEPIARGDAIVHAAPLSHGSGLYVVPNIARGAVNVVPESGGFDAHEVASLINAWPRAMLFAAPTMLKRLVQSPAASSID
ncbi:MAG TPA: class I adenylate-forming enzyme family protein, partial [Casimicrobiaceae bacterium]|nr:class I adenylate-forming enzyme family protein [Casimicrobiaceae bacterium]